MIKYFVKEFEYFESLTTDIFLNKIKEDDIYKMARHQMTKNYFRLLADTLCDVTFDNERVLKFLNGDETKKQPRTAEEQERRANHELKRKEAREKLKNFLESHNK